MILADTSVWVGHFRAGDARLAGFLADGATVLHPFVIEELACGGLPRRAEVLALLGAQRSVPVASHDEFMVFVEAHRLSASGLSLVDVHLLMSAMLAGASLWTHDAALAATARRLGMKVVA